MVGKAAVRVSEGADVVNAEQLAKMAEESYHSVDYWSEKGLLVFRRRGKRRLYPADENVRRIRFIRSSQERGHSLDGIRDNMARQFGAG